MIANIIYLPQRLELLKNELKRQHIDNYKLWEGFTDKTPRENILKSHKQIVLDAKEKNESCVLIMEDDVYFPHEHGFKIFLDGIPKNKDFDIYLGGVYVVDGILNQNTQIIRGFSGLHCYIVNKRFYDTFLSCESWNSNLDALLNGKGRYVIQYPMTAIQHEIPSLNNIGNIYTHEGFFRNKKVLGLNC